jgi:hypothetical protein
MLDRIAGPITLHTRIPRCDMPLRRGGKTKAPWMADSFRKEGSHRQFGAVLEGGVYGGLIIVRCFHTFITLRH